jgi:hypothetical protein
MMPDQAAWVRQNAWPAPWLRAYQHIPGTFLDCACQRPPSLNCQSGDHHRCAHDGHPVRETVVQTSSRRAAQFSEPYEHRPPSGHRGRRDAHGRNDLAWVWLAGRPCRELCTCVCHQPAPPDGAAAVLAGEQLDMFAVP